MDERIESNITRRDDGCWQWTGSTDPDGYGNMTVDGRVRRAHRAMYEFMVGPIPQGLVIDHLCRNPGCVNPEHMEPVTVQENTLRGDGITARRARQTHCIHGHPFDEHNTYIRKNGNRTCKACVNRSGREWRARQRSRSR